MHASFGPNFSGQNSPPFTKIQFPSFDGHKPEYAGAQNLTNATALVGQHLPRLHRFIMLRLALVCALVAVGLSAPAVPKSWTGHLSGLLVTSAQVSGKSSWQAMTVYRLCRHGLQFGGRRDHDKLPMQWLRWSRPSLHHRFRADQPTLHRSGSGRLGTHIAGILERPGKGLRRGMLPERDRQPRWITIRGTLVPEHPRQHFPQG